MIVTNFDWSRSGIYAIVDKETGNAYIGHTNCFANRWGWHVRDLHLSRSKTSRLQSAFDKHGLNGIEFVAIEYCEDNKSILYKREQHWIDVMFEQNRCLNTSRKARSGWIKGKKQSPEHIDKIRKINMGRKLSEEHKKKLSDSTAGIPLTEEHKRKISEGKRRSGYRHSPETRAKIAAATKAAMAQLKAKKEG